MTGSVVLFRDEVKLLGVSFDCAVTMGSHITKVVHGCNYRTATLPSFSFDSLVTCCDYRKY